MASSWTAAAKTRSGRGRCSMRPASARRRASSLATPFPTAAGLASSASGFAALAVAASAAAGKRPVRRGALRAGAAGQRLGDAQRPRRLGAVGRRVGAAGVSTLALGPALLRRGLRGRPQAGGLPRRHAHGARDLAIPRGMDRAMSPRPAAGALRCSRAGISPGWAPWPSAMPCGCTPTRWPRIRRCSTGSRPRSGACTRCAGCGKAAFRPGRTIDAGPHVVALCAPADAARVEAALRGVAGVDEVLVCSPAGGARVVP